MAIVINGDGTITGISVGGLPDGIVDAGTLATNSVDSAELVDGSIDTSHFSADCITADEIGDNVIDSEHYAAGSIDLEHMSSESVDEDNLHISNSGSNGQFLSKQSGDAGGLTWATPTDTNTMGSGFTVSATTDTNATTISQGEDLMFAAGTGITCETTADGTVTITNTSSGATTGFVIAMAIAL